MANKDDGSLSVEDMVQDLRRGYIERLDRENPTRRSGIEARSGKRRQPLVAAKSARASSKSQGSNREKPGCCCLGVIAHLLGF